ncbi:Fe-S-containing hydro-lyase [Desulfofundulus thermobenzoicus]|uniref:Fe-S-containing hydro-lyase n=1 Tax=Desulfofundulus thermobenzoicus TaxID=29376 RepID=A0A6N7IQQ5_9FIRM|nr:Fe-S-containing hydro-lyase [Desulfofundulus thermobenzoicus]MQL52396.1 Fe-S-containing hydro-lyase [Desulfofundulus thermobenzoicus]HHW43140.1 Fe-S-containing hydro-lyase [Desulfotomaculum sp.]
MSQIKLTTPLTDEVVENLRIGQRVLLNGVIYTGRDAAHKKLVELLDRGEELPIPLKGQVIYYVGPSPAKPGRVIGSAGPTTSGRMDAYAPRLIALGLKGMIGKGKRSPEVIKAMKQYRAVYFGAVGGAAALIARSIKSCRVVAYPELGPEAIHELVVENFPVIVVNDILGGDLYEEGVKIYATR